MFMITLGYAVIVWLEWKTLKRNQKNKRQSRTYLLLVGVLFLISLFSHIFKGHFQMSEVILHGFGPIEKWLTGH